MTADDFRKKARKLRTRRKRVHKSQERLRQDTEDVLKERPAEISISEACELTGISRSSFYDDFDLG